MTTHLLASPPFTKSNDSQPTSNAQSHRRASEGREVFPSLWGVVVDNRPLACPMTGYGPIPRDRPDWPRTDSSVSIWWALFVSRGMRRLGERAKSFSRQNLVLLRFRTGMATRFAVTLAIL